jgi:hypothetical protein
MVGLWNPAHTLVHSRDFGALLVGALFKVPVKVLIRGTLIKMPLIYDNLGHFAQSASNKMALGAILKSASIDGYL